MIEFEKHTTATAPTGSKAILESAQAQMGLVPNLYAVLAESPQTLTGYIELTKLFSASSLSTVERHVVWLAINVENRCHYCVPAHTFLALNDKTPQDVVDSLRSDTPIADDKLEALRRFAKQVVITRGFVAKTEIDAFLAAGYTNANVLDVVLGAAHKTISNYVNHLSETEVDAPFAQYAWTAPDT